MYWKEQLCAGEWSYNKFLILSACICYGVVPFTLFDIGCMLFWFKFVYCVCTIASVFLTNKCTYLSLGICHNIPSCPWQNCCRENYFILSFLLHHLVLWYCLWGDRKGISPVGSCGPAIPKSLLLHNLALPEVTREKNCPLKQKLNVIVVLAVLVLIVIEQFLNGTLAYKRPFGATNVGTCSNRSRGIIVLGMQLWSLLQCYCVLSIIKQDVDGSWLWSFWDYHGVSAKSFKCISIQAQSTYLKHFLTEVTTARYCILNFWVLNSNHLQSTYIEYVYAVVYQHPDRLLASSYHPSVCLSVTLCIVVLRVCVQG